MRECIDQMKCVQIAGIRLELLRLTYLSATTVLTHKQLAVNTNEVAFIYYLFIDKLKIL